MLGGLRFTLYVLWSLVVACQHRTLHVPVACEEGAGVHRGFACGLEFEDLEGAIAGLDEQMPAIGVGLYSDPARLGSGVERRRAGAEDFEKAVAPVCVGSRPGLQGAHSSCQFLG